ncbi:hypothetical protein BIS06_06645, partial [Halomonas sp. BBD48]|nr:hypothetical protein [Halomonas sp. BBD48]
MASDLDFNTEIVGATNNHTAAYGDFTFTGDGGANIAIMDGDSLIASPGDRALRFDYGGLGDPNAPEEVTTVSFRTTSGDDFALKGFEIDSGLGDDSIKIEGKRDGVVVATATLDLGFSSSNGGAVYTAIPDGWAGKITFTGWDNLDEVVITGLSSGGLDLDIDDIDVGPAIVPNTAPTITNGAEFALAETSEDAPSSATQVSTLLSGVGFSDEGSASGVAITGVSGEGVWQYSTDETTWTAFGAVNANASLLLSADTWVRFLPASDNATTATFSFRGWDQTTGTASSSNSPSTADTTVNGGSTAFSSSTASTTLSVSSVNDVPTATSLTQSKSFIEDAGLIALDDIVVREVDTGDTVTATLTMSDPAAGTLSPGSYGSATSTYNAGTGVWSVAGSVADVNAALANVGFAPSPDWNDTVTISTRIRDQHGTGPADGTITLQGTAVNDAPTGNVIIDGVPQEYE